MQENSSLLTPENRGGAVGQKGFNFQDAYIASRVPEWLSDPEFSALLKEGSGDVEIKFDGSEYRRDLYQVKDHLVKDSEFREVIDKFYQKQVSASATWRYFVFACRGFLNKGESLRSAIETFRGAAPMYGKKDPPLINTKREIDEKLKKLGLENVPSDFLIQKVKFDTDLGDMRTDQRLGDQFVGTVERCLPQYAGNLGLRNVYGVLKNKINEAIRITIGRIEIDGLFREAVAKFPERARQDGVTLRLYHWEDTPFDLSNSWDILLDWSEYFDINTRRVPGAEIWSSKLIPELEDAQKRIRANSDLRLIKFFPSACLSAGIAVGWSFSEVKGYTIRVPQRNDIWQTNCSPSASEKLNSTILEGDSLSRELVVQLSIVADVSFKVDKFLEKHQQNFRARLTLAADSGLASNITGPTALEYAYKIKHAIRNAVDKFACQKIHLFYAGPLALAVFIGWQFNAMHAPVQCYEAQSLEEGYRPSCLLESN